MATVTESVLTAEQFRQLPANGKPLELIRGRVVEMNLPTPRHGYLCNRVGRILGNFAEERGLGRVMNNHSGVLTEREPDTVRGPDVCYFSYSRLPKGPIPDRYLDVVPELVVEVRSRTDHWDRILIKVGEFLAAGVSVVCVLDEHTETLMIYRRDELPRTLAEDDDFTLPDIFGDEFRIAVGRFFTE